MTGIGIRPIVLLAIGLTLTFAPACGNTTEGVKQDSRDNAEKAREGVQAGQQESTGAANKVGAEAKETGSAIGHEAKEVGSTVKEGAKQIGTTVKNGAKDVAADVVASKQTVSVKAALKTARDIDASHIDVHSDADTRTVTLTGTVPTAAQKAAAEKVARDNAGGYEIHNLLIVSSR